jgi:squalene-hopene/tetraprenyl-beta-curcumene cyclase
MDGGRQDARRIRFDLGESAMTAGPKFDLASLEQSLGLVSDERVQTAVDRTREHLLGLQHADGFWVGELEGDTILESEYILLLTYLGRERSDVARKAANYLLAKQLPSGGWSIYPGGPV